MKTETRVLEVDSTLTGEKIGMTMDENATAHLMAVLTDLYTDAELAVIREYSTNAFDAHVEAGVTRPIEITLPSQLSPYLRIRDYGVGLDVEDIRNIYSRYGASSKRESNDVVGMLGLGCKSALTYTDQFTLTGIKDGVCTQVSVSRDEDGSGSMTIVAEYKTDDPSGVEVIVPVNRYNYFAQKARDFFRFWDEGTVLVNGEAPERVDGLWIADDLLLTKESDRRGGRDYVVMGNVAYPMSEVHYHNHSTIAFVKIGDVNFVPSREALQMTKKTKETLLNIQNRVKVETGPAIEKIVNEAKNKPEALALALKSRSIYREFDAELKYNGEMIPKMAMSKKTVNKVRALMSGKMEDRVTYDSPFIVIDGNKRRSRKGWETVNGVDASSFDGTIWLTGSDDKSFSPYKRLKLEQWIAEKNIERPNQFVMCDEVPADVIDWIEPKTIMNWSEVKEQKIVRENVKRSDGRPSGSYEANVCGVGTRTLQAADIDTTKPIFWASKYLQYASRPQAIVLHYNPNATIVYLGANRVAKFQRDFPNAHSLIPWCQEKMDKWVTALSKEELISIHLNESFSGVLRKFDADKIDDPDFKNAVEAVQGKNQQLKRYELFKHDVTLPKLDINPFDKYPLLTRNTLYGTMQSNVKDHIYLYINAVHAAEQEN